MLPSARRAQKTKSRGLKEGPLNFLCENSENGDNDDNNDDDDVDKWWLGG